MTVLVPMHPEVFAEVVEASIADYADQNATAGRWPRAAALARSHAEFASLLPQGLATPDHHWFEIHADAGGPRVGHLWFALPQCEPRTAFVYNVSILPSHRRQGHARRAFEALQPLAAAWGAVRIGLHVFAFNAPALALYRSLGYEVTSLNLNKALPPTREPA